MNNTKEFLGKVLEVKMDRMLGTRHPKHGFMYPVNYGYIPGTISGDGEELDAYVVGEFEPVETFSGKVIAIIHRKNDDDDKLIVAPIEKNYSDDYVEMVVANYIKLIQKKIFELEELNNSNKRTILSDVVDDESIAKIIAKWTNIPISKLVGGEKEKLINLYSNMKKRVKGQDNALELVSEAIKRARAGIKDPNRPIGSFMFLGPTRCR